MSAENGEYDCGTSYMKQLLSYFDAHMIGWMAWAWVSAGAICSYPQLVTDYSGIPTPNMGVLIFQFFRGYASVPAPVPASSTTPSPGPTPPAHPASVPVSKLGHFAEGLAAAGCNECLKRVNPQ